MLGRGARLEIGARAVENRAATLALLNRRSTAAQPPLNRRSTAAQPPLNRCFDAQDIRNFLGDFAALRQKAEPEQLRLLLRTLVKRLEWCPDGRHKVQHYLPLPHENKRNRDDDGSHKSSKSPEPVGSRLLYGLAAQNVGVSNQSFGVHSLHSYDNAQSLSPILRVHYDSQGTLIFDTSSLHSADEDSQEKDLFRLGKL